VALDVVKAGIAFFFAVVLQAAVVSAFEPAGGTADLVLVTLTAVALLRGAVFGAVAGFYAGFLLDAANLGTLGLSSLLLTLIGYWIGRYGETTGRGASRLRGQSPHSLYAASASRRLSPHAPLLAIVVVTVLYTLGGLAMHSLLGEPVSVHSGLLEALPAQIVLNFVLTYPVYAVCRRIFTQPSARPAVEVEFS
jgi:cell shape-determining protein MreD